MYTASPKYTGYHGTYPEYVDSILTNNFRESQNHDMWIGDGVYFFLEGAGAEHPREHAKQFAIDQCFNKETKTYDKKEICVLEAIIKVNSNKFLDLTQEAGNQLFNRFRNGILNKIEADGFKPTTPYKDSDVFKIMRKVLGIEFVKVNTYLKFGVERKKQTASIIPNVTIFVVNNPNKNILKPSIKTIYKGGIA